MELDHLGDQAWGAYTQVWVPTAGASGSDFSVDIWSVPDQDKTKPHEVPAVGRQLKGCRRLMWHHVRCPEAQVVG